MGWMAPGVLISSPHGLAAVDSTMTPPATPAAEAPAIADAPTSAPADHARPPGWAFVVLIVAAVASAAYYLRNVFLFADDYLFLVDRRVDLIITGGANVFPAEVEAALIDHPKIADVVVIGLDDDEWGKRVHAIIAPADPADPPTFGEVKAYVKDRLLAYKVPKTIELVNEIPRSEAMKVNRGRLIEARQT